MIKLLIVEDEPLVQIGIKTLLQNSSLKPALCPAASNGQAALEIIERERPEIVITDIKMPKMDGLELVRQCRSRFGDIPVFIILTNYEEFHLAKEALTLGVVDYLVKLELTAEMLDASIGLALRRLEELKPHVPKQEPALRILLYKERFFIRLLNNLFENEEQFLLQSRDLGLAFSEYQGFAAAYIELDSPKLSELNAKQQLDLLGSSFDMIQNILSRYLNCFCISLDTRHLAVLFLLTLDQLSDWQKRLKAAAANACSMVQSYYSANFSGACGCLVTEPMAIHESYQSARQRFAKTDRSQPLLFQEEMPLPLRDKSVFNMSLFKESITQAYEEYDAGKLTEICETIQELFSEHPDHYVQAMDAASNFLYLSISLISDGEALVSDIFSSSPSGYRCLYGLTTTGQIMDWLNNLCSGLCTFFNARKKDYKNHIVAGVRQYIQAHLQEKLPLNEVAAAFGISPNYLSLLFKKYSDCGFSEYVTQMRIGHAKELLQEGNLKIYEIADQLGFENAFYFSKVFKKVEGCSPREYQYQCFSTKIE